MNKIYAADVVRIAAGEVGYLEKATNKNLDSQTGNPGKGNWTKYSRDLFAAKPSYYNGNKNGFDWCTSFVDWCIYMAANQDSKAAQKAVYYTDVYGASCTYSVGYYKAAGRFWARKAANPKPGDQIFFGDDANIRHTGLVERVTDGVIYTIEGNSGNAVRRRSYALSSPDIYGYGRPKYDGDKAPEEDQEPASEAEKAGARDSRRELEAAVRAVQEADRAACMTNDAGDWSREAREWAIKLGLVKGVGRDKDGMPIYAWQLPLTLERFIVVLYRYDKYTNGGG